MGAIQNALAATLRKALEERGYITDGGGGSCVAFGSEDNNAPVVVVTLLGIRRAVIHKLGLVTFTRVAGDLADSLDAYYTKTEV